MLCCADLGLVEYSQALTLQESLVEKRRRGEGQNGQNGNDTLLLLEHPPVFTLGRGADESFVLNPRQVPVHRVSRGGQVTFHGPGQLVGYPILALPHHRRDVHAYIRSLENVLIDTLAVYGLQAQQREGLTGVWLGEQKIASIGVGLRRWVTFHGFALNVDPDLSYFNDIIPCGLHGVQMTSMAQALGCRIALDEVKVRLAEIFADTFGYKETVWNTSSLISDSPSSLNL
jgi:lipoate-protein ligase B